LAKGIRVNQLAKELGVESKSILTKIKDEGLGDKAPNHMSVLPLGLAESVREWFSGGGVATAVETAPPPAKTKKARPPARKKTESAAEEPHDDAAAATAEAPATRPTMSGLRVTDVAKLLSILGEQGTVTTVARPRLLTMNNEPSIIRTEAVSFTVTPQISGDAVLTLSLTPIVKSPIAVESDMLARVMDGETLVVSGFTREREVTEEQKKPAGLIGGTWFNRPKIVTVHKQSELVILLTAKIIAGVGAQ